MNIEDHIRNELNAENYSSAVTRAIAAYGGMISGYLSAITRTAADREEVYQQALKNVWSGAANFRREGSFRNWMIRIATREAARYYRGRRVLQPSSDAVDGLPHSPGYRSGDWATWQIDVVDELLRSLPLGERKLLVLRVVFELSYDEISEHIVDEDELSPNPGALRVALHRILKSARAVADARAGSAHENRNGDSHGSRHERP